MSNTGDNARSVDALSTSDDFVDVPNASRPATVEPKSGTSETRNKRKLKSWVWEHFEKNNNASDPKSTCKYCSKSLVSPAASGTSCLSNHLKRCKKYPYNVDKEQSVLAFPPVPKFDDDDNTVNVLANWKFDQAECRKWLARMIIVDELPFIFVEHNGFRGFCRVLQPRFIVPSRRTIGRDCYLIYTDEMSRLKDSFKKLSSRICLTTDSWTSIQNLSYMCLTAHFIDDSWRLHKRIISFCPISGHSGEIIGMAVERCLLNWGIEKVFSVTVDNASSNDVGLQYLKRRLNSWKGTVLGGEYLHMRCAAHILNLVVKDGLSELNDSIVRIRNAIKYVRSSPARLQKFKNCIEKEKIDSKSHVCLDVETRWNSTYLMLDAAIKFQKAFDLLELTDIKYAMELTMKSGTPTSDDWDYAKSLMPFLKVFYDTTLGLSGSLHVTSNEYMKKIFGLGLMIDSKIEDNDANLKGMAMKMKKKFGKYWENVDNINILLFIALIIDPRCKMQYVTCIIDRTYDITRATRLKDKVRSVLDSLFLSYGTSQPLCIEISSGGQTATSTLSSDVSDVSMYADSFFDKQNVDDMDGHSKSELDKYLTENREVTTPTFEILNWWRVNASRYPTLALIARDVLAIPVSTVASESAFSTGGRVLDSFRSALTPRIVESLVCAQNWLRSSSEPIHLDNILEQLEAISLEESCITEDHPLCTLEE